MCGHLISRTTSPTRTHRYYQRVIIYFFTGIVGELILNISVEPMYYIQNMHSLRGLSRNGVGTTSIRSVEASTNEHPGKLFSRDTSSARLFLLRAFVRFGGGKKPTTESKRKKKDDLWKCGGVRKAKRTMIYIIYVTRLPGILSRSSRRWCSRFHTVRKTRPRYDFTFYFYNKCSRT